MNWVSSTSQSLSTNHEASTTQSDGMLFSFNKGRGKGGWVSINTSKCDKILLTAIEHMCYSGIVQFFGRRVMELEQIDGSMLDLPPEYCHYRDEGCEFASSCLNCPLPKCVYDEPGGGQHWRKKLRDREMTRLFSRGGKGIKELALMFGISQRTAQRALKRAGNE